MKPVPTATVILGHLEITLRLTLKTSMDSLRPPWTMMKLPWFSSISWNPWDCSDLTLKRPHLRPQMRLLRPPRDLHATWATVLKGQRSQRVARLMWGRLKEGQTYQIPAYAIAWILQEHATSKWYPITSTSHMLLYVNSSQDLISDISNDITVLCSVMCHNILNVYQTVRFTSHKTYWPGLWAKTQDTLAICLIAWKQELG